MRKKALLAPVVLAVLSVAPMAAAQPAVSLTSNPERDVPAFLPRSAFAGVMINGGAVSPVLRVQWEWKFLEQGKDLLALVVEGGGGYAVAFPSDAGELGDGRMTFFYQHTAMIGVGYRGRRYERFRWGVDVLTGPLWYGARFDKLPRENRLTGNLEGRLRMGWDVGPMTLGVSAGFSSYYSRAPLSNAAPYGGGFMVGLFADWWH